MILEEETYRKFGYYSSELTPQSCKKIIVACDECGKVREVRKDAYHALCKSCAHKGERSTRLVGKSNPMFGRIGDKHPLWKKRIGRICEACGTKFPAKSFDVKRGRGRFCSKSCARTRTKFPTHHTKPELIFEQICQRNNIDFHYVGDGQLWIGKRKKLNPDFIEANGRKILVEIFGDYWHSPLINRNMKEHGTLEYRKRHYKRFKWTPIFIWESDLKRKDVEQFVLSELKKEGVIK